MHSYWGIDHGTEISKAASDNWRYLRGSIEEQGFKPKNKRSTYSTLTRAANKGYRDDAKKNPRRLLVGTASGVALGGIATRSPLGALGGAAIGSTAAMGYGLTKSGKSQNNAFRGALQREIDAGRVTYRKPRK